MNWRISIAMAFAALSAFAAPAGDGDESAALHGVVTHMYWPDGYFFMRTDKGEDWRVSMDGREKLRLSPGDIVDVDGLLEPVRNRHTRRLFYADATKVGHDPKSVPQNVPMSISELLAQPGDGALVPDWYARPVAVAGRLHDFWRRDNMLTVVLEEGGQYIYCKINVGIDVPFPDYFSIGARVQTKGIALFSAEWGEGHKLVGFGNVTILASGMGALEVLSRPPFWTVGRLALLLAVVVGILAVLGVWNVLMRRAVRRALAVREKAVRDKAAAEAVVRERLRLSHDLHDNFQQLLASCAFSLAATTNYVKSDAPKDEILSALRDVEDTLQHTQTGLRAALWSISEEAEGPSRFSDLIRYAAGRLAHWEGVVDFSFEGRETPMARQHAGALLMVLQEAVANAIRHGRARKVHVAVAFEDSALEMSIVDDGVGFDQDSAEVRSPGHMGLSGMRTRVANLGGTFRIESLTGEGTRIVIRMPL